MTFFIFHVSRYQLSEGLWADGINKKGNFGLTVASGLAGSRCSNDIVRLHFLYNKFILRLFLMETKALETQLHTLSG